MNILLLPRLASDCHFEVVLLLLRERLECRMGGELLEHVWEAEVHLLDEVRDTRVERLVDEIRVEHLRKDADHLRQVLVIRAEEMGVGCLDEGAEQLVHALGLRAVGAQWKEGEPARERGGGDCFGALAQLTDRGDRIVGGARILLRLRLRVADGSEERLRRLLLHLGGEGGLGHVLGHDAHAIDSRLPHLRRRVLRVLHERGEERGHILGGAAVDGAVFDDVVEDAERRNAGGLDGARLQHRLEERQE